LGRGVAGEEKATKQKEKFLHWGFPCKKLFVRIFVTIQLVIPVSGVSTASNIIVSSWNDPTDAVLLISSPDFDELRRVVLGLNRLRPQGFFPNDMEDDS
jgi:hypothetical protein